MVDSLQCAACERQPCLLRTSHSRFSGQWGIARLSHHGQLLSAVDASAQLQGVDGHHQAAGERWDLGRNHCGLRVCSHTWQNGHHFEHHFEHHLPAVCTCVAACGGVVTMDAAPPHPHHHMHGCHGDGSLDSHLIN